MDLLYIGNYMFKKNENGFFGLPSSSNEFFSKYLSVFRHVRIIGEPLKSNLSAENLVEVDSEHFSVRVIPPNRSPRDMIKNDRTVKNALYEEISKADSIILKPLSRKGIMAIKIAERLKKPYMIEMTGDIHNALKQNPSMLKRIYAPILYSKIKRAIKNAPYGLYVSKDYLQSQFPINGKMCGCSDVVLLKSDASVLENRFRRIETQSEREYVELALIGFYQGLMKGVDTAIRALSRLPKNYRLHILGNGTEENRKKWLEYGEKLGVTDRIFFPKPLPSSEAVLHWLDTVDAFVLPTRSEGLCRCVAEAISRGCPCFATDICTMPELLPRECLHPLCDDSALAEQILKVMSDPEKAKKYASVNFEKAKEYDFDVLKQRRDLFLADFKKYCEEVKQ